MVREAVQREFGPRLKGPIGDLEEVGLDCDLDFELECEWS